MRAYLNRTRRSAIAIGTDLSLSPSFCHSCKAALGKGEALSFKRSHLFYYLHEKAITEIYRGKNI